MSQTCRSSTRTFASRPARSPGLSSGWPSASQKRTRSQFSFAFRKELPRCEVLRHDCIRASISGRASALLKILGSWADLAARRSTSARSRPAKKSAAAPSGSKQTFTRRASWSPYAAGCQMIFSHSGDCQLGGAPSAPLRGRKRPPLLLVSKSPSSICCPLAIALAARPSFSYLPHKNAEPLVRPTAAAPAHEPERMLAVQSGAGLPVRRPRRLHLAGLPASGRKRGCRGFSSSSAERVRLAGPSKLKAGRSSVWTWTPNFDPPCAAT